MEKIMDKQVILDEVIIPYCEEGGESNNRIDEINYNNYGNKMTIIGYINNSHITVEFDNGWRTTSRYQLFKRGSIKSPYCKSVCSVGYLGEGEHKKCINGNTTKEYEVWKSMLTRCYNDKLHTRRETYKYCSVCDEWLNFQNFAQWFDENYYTVDNEKMCLDKDILMKDNKIYSPETCIFVSNDINNLFVRHDSVRGEYPIGVSKNIKNNKFMSSCHNIIFGRDFNTPIEAFEKYKIEKEKFIKYKAEEYKDKIPKKLYNAMITYKVEIND